ncbi:MAG TPA: carboxynorspermidine decarboxylase [Oscillospiraceae bacterium]|nr:carboxynorspermidine decarboxylase [Oscillospiraceae bacterium]
MLDIDILKLPTPCYITDEKLLIKNLEVLKSVKDRTGCKILLAQKAFSMYSTYPLISEYLDGVTSSGLFEARLGFEEMGKEVHTFAPAFREDEIEEIISYSDHMVFNSFSQWKKFREKVKLSDMHIECGIRINPEYSEIETDIYNPCFENSRLGVTLDNFEENELDGIDGLHFHTMCEQNSDTLERTLEKVEEKFGKYLHKMKWLNFGGGHHITRKDYDLDRLVKCINHIKDTYNIQVYIEPGEAVALNAGFLVTEVLDVIKNGMDIAIVDTSAACHMPDVLEMPYRPNIIGSGLPLEKKYTYRLGAPTCLAGDIIGDYSFDERIKTGDRLVFCDMAIYSMVKTNTFNGINLPSIMLLTKENEIKLIKKFGYEDFKSRL